MTISPKNFFATMMRGMPTGMTRVRKWLAGAIVIACLALLIAIPSTQAAYVQVYNTIQKGAITFTGNTLGLNDTVTSGQAGAFIAADLSTNVAGYPAGTTLAWASNLSRAQLSIPIGATVLHAELIWTGKLGGAITTTVASSTSVRFITPAGSYVIAPSISTASNSANYYTRSATVTGLVQIGGSGTYSAGGVPALVDTSTTDGAGWTLAVVYADPAQPARNLTIFVGNEPSGGAVAAVSGFCTPGTGPVNGRLAVSAIEGDAGGTGDTMLFGPTSVLNATTHRVSGPNNPIGNFFASQINGDSGTLNTSGTFGTVNQPLGGNLALARQAYDITNVDASALLTNGQTTAFAQGTSTGDVYAISALGLQINVNTPVFPVTVKQVNKTTTFVGDQLIYSIDLDNRPGNGAATGVVLYDNIPSGTSLVPGSVMVDTNPPLPNNPTVQTGVVQTGADPVSGITIGTVAVGSIVRVSFRVNVIGLPASPAPAKFDNAARWTYTYIACAGVAAQTGSVTTGTVTTSTARLEPFKTVSPTGALVGGQTATYTITIPNTGLINTAGTTLADPIPAGTTYVAGSTKLNGVAIADGPGSTMPFTTAAPVNSAGQAAGVIAVGASATVQFSVVATSGATVNNLASIDPDGAGPSPVITVSAVNSGLSGPTVNKAFSPASIGAGGTSTLTVTLTNPNATAITGVNVTDNLPGGMLIATPANAATTCTGGTVTATPSGIVLALTGASIPASGSCTFSAGVTANTAGSYVNTIPAGAVTSSNAGASTAGSQTLTVTPAPAISKSFSPGTVASNVVATLTITLTNPSVSAMTAATFTDTFPTVPGAMTLFDTTTTNTCGGTLTTAAGGALAAGSTSVKLTGGTIPAGNVCTITVRVKAPAGGSYINTIPVNALTTSGGSSSTAAVATLEIASPQVTKTFAATIVAANTATLMTITLTNITGATITGLAFTDTYPAGLVNTNNTTTNTCGGTATASATATNPGTLTLSGATTLAAGSSCAITVNVQSATSGTYTNTLAAGAVSSSIGPNVVAASATLNVARPNIGKAFSTATIPLNGTATLTVTLSNPTATAMTGAAFIDTLPNGLTASTPGGTCVGTKAATSSTLSLSGGTIPASGSCTVTALITGTTVGLKVNTITAGGLTVTGPAAASNGSAATADITVLAAPTITKSFLTSPILPVTGVTTLQLILENGNSVALTGATFTDVFPATPGAMTLADLITTNTCSGTLTNNAGAALAVGAVGIKLAGGTIPANGSCSITVHVKASLAGDYINTVPATPTIGFLNTTEGGGNTVAATAPLAVRLAAPTVAKSFSPSTIVANTSTTLTLTITNPSTTQAITGAAWSDIFPAGMKVFSIPGFTNTCGGTVTVGSTANDTSIAISGATIPFNAGGTGSCSISVAVTSTVVAASPGIANTTGTVTSANANTSATASANLVVTTPPLSAPTIAKAFGPSSIVSGNVSTLTFTMGSANTGILNNANFTDTLINMSVASSTIGGTCTGVTNSPALVIGATALNLTVPNLPPGGCTVSVQVTSSTLGTHSNTASGVTTTQTPTAGTGSNTVTLTVANVPLTVTKTTSTPTIVNTASGTTATYTVTVTNGGTAAAIGVKVTDVLPITAPTAGGITYASTTSVTLNGTAVAASGYTVGGTTAAPQWDTNPAGGFTINAGQTLVITFVANVANTVVDGTYNNSANVTSTNANIINNFDGAASATENVTVTSPILVVTKTTSTPTVVNTSTGTTATYTVTVTNSGTANATGVVLTDTLPSGFSFGGGAAVTLNGTLLASTVYTETAGATPTWTTSPAGGFTINTGQTLQVVFTATVVNSVADGTYNNSASVVSTNAKTLTNFDGTAATENVTITSAVLTVVKTTSTPVVTNLGTGTTATYTIAVTNSGTANATSVKVTDTLPAGFTYGSTTSVTLNGSVFTTYAATGTTVPQWDTSPTGGFTISAGKTLVITFVADVAPAVATGSTYSNSASAVSSNAKIITNFNGTSNTSDDVTVTALAGVNVSGTTYKDANHNLQQDSSETGTGLVLYAKLIAASGTTALQAVAVNTTSGAYTFPTVVAGGYRIILDSNNSLADITPTVPAGWLGTEMPDFTRTNIQVANTDLQNLNFGLYNGGKLSGTVFNDTGTGGGIANNGIKEAGETSIAGVVVKATNSAGTVIFDSTTTNADGNYTLWVPTAVVAATLKIVELNLGGYLSTGGAIGNTGGSYDRPTDTVTLSNVTGGIFAGVNFADAPVNRLAADSQQSALPGNAVFYAHRFNAGSAGTVNFSAVSDNGWPVALYRDSNCNSQLDTGEPIIIGAISIMANEQVCVIDKITIPPGATLNAQDKTTIGAGFSYTNASPALSTTLTLTDITHVGSAGLALIKSIDKLTVQLGEHITYTITYQNNGSAPVSAIVLRDATPAYTTFLSANCIGALPSGITACAVSTQPAAGAKGTIEWTLTGGLSPAASGQVSFTVQVDN